MNRYRVTPIEEMWAWRDVWVVFKDVGNILCDVTGSIIEENSREIIIGNREDHHRYRIPKEYIELTEEV